MLRITDEVVEKETTMEEEMVTVNPIQEVTTEHRITALAIEIITGIGPTIQEM